MNLLNVWGRHGSDAGRHNVEVRCHVCGSYTALNLRGAVFVCRDQTACGARLVARRQRRSAKRRSALRSRP